MLSSFLALEDYNKKRIRKKLEAEVTERLEAAVEILTATCAWISSERLTHIKKPIHQLLILQSEIYESVSKLLFELEPAVPNETSFVGMIRHLSDLLLEPLDINVCIIGKENSLDTKTLRAKVLYRVAQEALLNVSKHSHAKRTTIVIKEEPGEFSLVIADDGIGFNPEILTDSGNQSCLGLAVMNSWLSCIGGHLLVDTKEGEGTRVVAKIKR